MSPEIISGLSIAIAVVVILVIKLWFFKRLRFKMDESAIVAFFKTSNDKYWCSTETISAGTDIGIARISEICGKSKGIEQNANKQESWRLKKNTNE